MKKNVGNADRYLRIFLGIIIAILGIVFQSWWGLLAILPIGTAFMRFCPAYMPFGISTMKSKEEKAS